MPKLPEVTSLGRRPAVQTPLGRVSYKATHGAETAPGQGLVRIGLSIDQANEEIAKENLRVDTLLAEDAFNKLREKQVELSVGDDGFTKKRGTEAINKPLITDYGKRFADTVNQIAGTLGNDQQKALFRKRAVISELQFKQDMANHVTREKDAYARQVFDGTIETETASAVERYLDPNGVALAKERINRAITAEAERTGMAPVDVQAMRLKVESAVNRGILERHLAAGNDQTATALYKGMEGKLTANDRIAIEKQIEVASTRGNGQRNADRILAKHGDNFGLAIDEAKKIKDPKDREATMANIRQAKADNEAAKKLDIDNAFTAAMQTVQSTGNTMNVPPDAWVRIGKDGQDALERMAAEVREKRTPTQDVNKWAEFNEKSKDRNWLTGLSEKDFAGYLFSFDEQHRDRASALRDAAIEAAKGDAKAKDFLRSDLNLGEMVKTKVFNAGIIDPTKKTANYSEDEKRLLNDIELQASKELEEFQVKNKRKATTQEEEEVVRRLLLPHLKVRLQKSWWFDPEKSLGELTPEERGQAYVEYKSVPADDRSFLESRARSLGAKDVSEERIARAYTILITTPNVSAADRRARIDAILRGQ